MFENLYRANSQPVEQYTQELNRHAAAFKIDPAVWKTLPVSEASEGRLLCRSSTKSVVRMLVELVFSTDDAGRILKNLSYRYWDSHGNLASEDLDDGINNEHRGYFPTGQIRSNRFSVDGKLEGPSRIWNMDGVVAIEEHWANGELDGEKTSRNDDGTISSRFFYKDGKLDGECCYYHDNGVPSHIMNYKEGELYGPQLLITPNDEVVSVNYFMNGQCCTQADFEEEQNKAQEKQSCGFSR